MPSIPCDYVMHVFKVVNIVHIVIDELTTSLGIVPRLLLRGQCGLEGRAGALFEFLHYTCQKDIDLAIFQRPVGQLHGGVNFSGRFDAGEGSAFRSSRRRAW